MNNQGLWIPVEILRDERLSPSEKMVYAAVNNFSKKDGVCKAYTKTLAEYLGFKYCTVKHLLDLLKKKGFIVSKGRGIYRELYCQNMTKSLSNNDNIIVKKCQYNGQNMTISLSNNDNISIYKEKEKKKKRKGEEKEASPQPLPESNYQEVLNDKRRIGQEFKKAVPDEWADLE